MSEAFVQMQPHRYTSTGRATGRVTVIVGGVDFTVDTEEEALNRVEKLLAEELEKIRAIKTHKAE